MRQDGQRFACAMVSLQAGQKPLAVGIVTQEQWGSFRKGPREMGLADVLARGAQAFAGGCFRPRDQATLRGAVLHPWEAGDVMEFVEPHEAEDFPNARHGWQQGQGVGIVLLGGFQDSELEILE
jgi:hypothetical protein